MMSIRVMSWVWEHSRAAGIDRLVLLAIADAANDDGQQAWPSGETLARKTGVNLRTVQRSVRRLVELGEVSVKTNAGKGGTNVYRVHLATQTPGTAPPPRPPVTPALRHPRRSATPAETTQTPGTAPPEPSLNRPTESLRDSASEIHRDDVERVCAHLADRIEANGSKRPKVTARWRDSARLLLDADARTEQQIHNAIDWSQGDEFWRANVLSMPTLREKYDQLRLAAQRPKVVNGRSPTPPTPTPPPAREVLASIDARVDHERAVERHRMAGITGTAFGAMPA